MTFVFGLQLCVAFTCVYDYVGCVALSIALATQLDLHTAFVTDLQSAQFHFSIICIHENDDISQIELENYTCVTQGKSSSTKGGLVMYINNNFNLKINKLFIRKRNWEAQVITLSGGGLSR